MSNQFPITRTPWANDGKNVDGTQSMREAMEKAGLDQRVEVVPTYHEVTKMDPLAGAWAAPVKTMEVVPHHHVIRNAETMHVYGKCKDRWEPLQNVDAFEWFQPAMDAGLIKLNTVGSLNQGAKIWILAELCKPPVVVVPGEEICKYILLGNGHDAATSIFVGFTPIRFWCANMLPQLRADEATSLIRLRHTKNAAIELEKLREMINYADAQFEASAELYQQLVRTNINTKDMEKYVRILLCDESEQEVPRSELSTRKSNIIDKVVGLMETGYGLQNARIKGTYFAAFNAMNQYLNYESGRNSNNRLNSLWFGQGRNLNDRALTVAHQMSVAA